MVGWLYDGVGNRKFWWRHNWCWQKKTIEKGEFENNDNLNEGSKSQCSSVWLKDISAGDIIFMDDLKEAVEQTAEFENSEHLNEGSKSQVSFSATSIFLRGDLEEVVQKNAEFENSDNLKKGSWWEEFRVWK